MIILQFDNVHLTRDNPNVPSDIEQIPALYNFLKGQGTLLSNDHTVLISHTADGITSTETGLYPGNEGLGVANSFEYFVPYGSGTANASAFTYWTDPVSSSDRNYEMISSPPVASKPMGNTPAPWVPFTRAGCDFAGIGSANMEFENDTRDVANVYGAGSPQYALGNWSYNTAYQKYNAGSNLGATDFEGLAIHCSYAESQTGGLCSSANGGEPDSLPDEPGTYIGYNGLFGALAVDNVGPHKVPDPGDVGATDSPPPDTYTPGVTPTTKILDWTLNPGFPGFDGMEANNALGYTAAAQEAGIPVESNSPGDSTYTGMDSQLQACASARASLVAQIGEVLQAAEDGDQPVSHREARTLVGEADALISDAATLASSPTPPAGTVCS